MPVEFRSGKAKMVVDPGRGGILRIEHSVSGVAFLDGIRDGRLDGQLFRLVIPADMWWSCYADSRDQNQFQSAETEHGLTIEYPDLKDASGRQTGIRVRVEISARGGKDEFFFGMHVENNGRRTVIDAAFPLLGGWYEKGGQSRITLGANRIITPMTLAYPAGNNYCRNGKREAWDYPVGLACPWADFSGPDGGLGYINYMAQGYNGKFWIENLAGYGDDFRLMFGWLHMGVIGPGDSWNSPDMGIMVHDGDWRSVAARYSGWFDKQHPPDYSRPAVRSRIGFQNYFLRGFDGTPVNKFVNIPGAAAEGRRYGVDMLCIWDMLTLGNYSRYDPHDLTDYSPENRGALREGLRLAEKEGTKTCALVNFRHPNVGLHLSNPDILNRVQRRYTGTFRTENWAGNHTFGSIGSMHIGPESYVFSPFSPEHRERVLRLTGEYLDLGYSSMFYDQPFELYPDYGFTGRGHPPETTHHEALKLVGDVRKLLLSRDPQAVVIGEESDIHATPCIDQWMSWSIASPSEELFDRLALMRYSMPHTILSWVVDHEPDRAAIAFAMGMQLCLMVHGGEKTLAEEPAFAERVRAMAVLRRKTAGRTVMARFIGRDGLEIDGERGFHAYAYKSASGPAVIAAACGRPARGRVRVHQVHFSRVSDEGLVFGLDGSQRPAKGTTCEFSLGENEVAVWMP